MITQLGRNIDHPFLCSQKPHTITIGSPALYPAKEPRRLGCCESSGGNRNLFLPFRGPFLIGSFFCQNVPYYLAQPSGQGDGRGVRAFPPLVVLKENTAIRGRADRTPGRFYQGPSQPFIAHRQKFPVEDSASGGIGRRHQSGIGREFRRTNTTFDLINFHGHHSREDGSKTGNSSEKLNLGVISQKRCYLLLRFLDQLIENLKKFQVFPQDFTINPRKIQLPQISGPPFAEDIGY